MSTEPLLIDDDADDRALSEQVRLEGLLLAVACIPADLRLPIVLQRVLSAACLLVGARSGALTVPAADGEAETLLTHGVSPAALGRIRSRQDARQVVSVGIAERTPLALADAGEFPGPRGRSRRRMKSFLWVPIRVSDKAFAHLWLTGKEAGDGFDAADELLAGALAAVASTAVGNTQLFAALSRQRGWLDAAGATTRAPLGDGDHQDALQVAVNSVRVVEGADAGALFVDDGDGLQLSILAGSAQPPTADLAGTPAPAAQLLANLAGPSEVDPAMLGWPAGRALLVPLHVADRLAAVLALGWLAGRGPDGELDPVTTRQFLEQVVLVRELAYTQAAQARLAVAEDRDRIARDLHDHVIQRLFAVGMSLQSSDAEPPAAAAVDAAIDSIDDTIRDLRRAIFHLQERTTEPEGRGELDELLATAADGLGFLPGLSVIGPWSRVAPSVRREFLAVLREALSNVVRHAGASCVDVEVEVGVDGVAASALSTSALTTSALTTSALTLTALTLTVTDDGRGIDEVADSEGPPRQGCGLPNAAVRAQALRGWADVRRQPAGGTRLRWHVPLGQD